MVGFLFLAVSLLAAGGVLARTIAGKAGRVGALLVCLAGVAAVVTAFAQEDCSDLKAACAARERANTVSGEHVLHNLVGLVLFAALVIALFFLAAGLRRATGRDHPRAYDPGRRGRRARAHGVVRIRRLRRQRRARAAGTHRGGLRLAGTARDRAGWAPAPPVDVTRA